MLVYYQLDFWSQLASLLSKHIFGSIWCFQGPARVFLHCQKQHFHRTAKNSRLQIPAGSTWLPSLLQKQLTCPPNISQVSLFQEWLPWHSRSGQAHFVCPEPISQLSLGQSDVQSLRLFLSGDYRCKGRLEDNVTLNNTGDQCVILRIKIHM